MENLKNMVVLKNLPSNIIDEAFLILKPNQKIEITTPKQEERANSNDYVIKEAEMVISSYLNKNDTSIKKEFEKLRKQCRKLKIISISLLVAMTLGIILRLIF